jgi:hypothetical protein
LVRPNLVRRADRLQVSLSCFCVLDVELNIITIYTECFFNKLDAFTALRFTGTGSPLAAGRMRILPMTQHADNIWNEGKFLPSFTDHRRC